MGVMGSGSKGHERLSVCLGQWLAKKDVHLLTGGGQGVMSTVSKAFHEVQNRAGLVIGVLPSGVEEIRFLVIPIPG